MNNYKTIFFLFFLIVIFTFSYYLYQYEKQQYVGNCYFADTSGGDSSFVKIIGYSNDNFTIKHCYNEVDCKPRFVNVMTKEDVVNLITKENFWHKVECNK